MTPLTRPLPLAETVAALCAGRVDLEAHVEGALARAGETQPDLRAALFDLDGTLADSDPLIAAAVVAPHRSDFLLDPEDSAGARRAVGGGAGRDRYS